MVFSPKWHGRSTKSHLPLHFGVEQTALRLTVSRSTNWANGGLVKFKKNTLMLLFTYTLINNSIPTISNTPVFPYTYNKQNPQINSNTPQHTSYESYISTKSSLYHQAHNHIPRPPPMSLNWIHIYNIYIVTSSNHHCDNPKLLIEKHIHNSINMEWN